MAQGKGEDAPAPFSQCNETALYFVLNYDPGTSINGRIDRKQGQLKTQTAKQVHVNNTAPKTSRV